MDKILPLKITDIDEYAKYKFKDKYKGTHIITDGKPDADLLNSINENLYSKCFYIFLMLKNNEDTGHYTGLFIDDGIGKYFDPFGTPTYPKEIKRLFDIFYYNKRPIQKIMNSKCGLHVLSEAFHFLGIHQN